MDQLLLRVRITVQCVVVCLTSGQTTCFSHIRKLVIFVSCGILDFPDDLSCSKFELICPLIFWDSTVGWNLLEDYSSCFSDILRDIHQQVLLSTFENVSVDSSYEFLLDHLIHICSLVPDNKSNLLNKVLFLTSKIYMCSIDKTCFV